MATAISENASHAGHLVVGTDPVGMSAARHHVHSIAKRHFSDDEAQDILIAVGEAMSNAYRHGTRDRKRGLIYVDWCFANRVFTVSIKDDGPGLPPGAHIMLTGKASRIGHGFDIIRRTVDDVYAEHDDGTRLVLKKRAGWNLPDLS